MNYTELYQLGFGHAKYAKNTPLFPLCVAYMDGWKDYKRHLMSLSNVTYRIIGLMTGMIGIGVWENGMMVGVEVDFPTLEETRLYYYTHSELWQ